MHVFHYIKNLRANSSEPENLRALFALYWRTLLVCTGILIIVIFVYGVWQILDVMNESPAVQTDASAPSGPQSAPINTAQADSVFQGFARRQAQFDAHKTQAPAIADPR